MNNFAISSAGIGDSLQRSASSLAAANTSLEETIALTTAANEIMQDPLKVGTSLKTISARVRGAKSELEELGETGEEVAVSTAKLQSTIKALSGVDIMSSKTEFKSIYQVFDELAQVWGTLDDISQATIAEKLGGKNGLNTVYSIISNFQTAREVMGETENAAGSANEELAKSLDSIEGKLGKLSATFQELSSNLLDSDALKWILDFLNGAAQLLAKIAPLVEKILPIVGIFAGTKLLGKAKNGLGEPAKHWVPLMCPEFISHLHNRAIAV